MGRGRVPLWLKLAYAAGASFVGVANFRLYGPRNFLWLSDLALASTAAAVVTERPLLASAPAVAVLPLEAAWHVDLVAGGRLGLAAYMHDARTPLLQRAVSLFHVALPPTWLFLLRRLGYDRRAFRAQLPVTLAALALSYGLGTPRENINMVYGAGSRPQTRLPRLAWLGIVMVGVPLLSQYPTHLLLGRLFRRA